MQDLIRFLLATVILLFHYSHFPKIFGVFNDQSIYHFPAYDFIKIIYSHGYHAVNIFFALSGYIIYRKYQFVSANRYDFFSKRLARIYPAHILTLFVIASISFILFPESRSEMEANNTTATFIYNILMIQNWWAIESHSYNLPSWSLSVEMLLYLTLIANSFSQTPLRNSILLIAFGIFINVLPSNPHLKDLGNGFIYFFVGVVTCHILSRINLIESKMGGTAILIISFYLSLDLNYGFQKLIWICICIPAGLYILHISEGTDRSRRFKIFGLLSFSTYIWHFPVQLWLVKLFAHRSEIWLEPSFLIMYLCATFATATISLAIIEPIGSKIVYWLISRLFSWRIRGSQ